MNALDDLSNIFGQKQKKKWEYSAKGPDNSKKEQHQEELWLYSYADLITNLLLFFVMMFAISSVDTSKFNAISAAIQGDDKKIEEISSAEKATETKQMASQLSSIEQAKGTEKNQQIVQIVQVILGKMDGAALELDADTKKAMDELKKRLEKLTKVTPEDEPNTTFEVHLPNDKFFEKGKSTPTVQGKAFLRKVAQELKNAKFKYALSVEGHTDSTELGKSKKANALKWDLSSRRAAAVLDSLMEYGVKAQNVSIAGYGDSKPAFPERDATGKVNSRNQGFNRRVVVKVTRVGSGFPVGGKI